jgi:serine protease
MLAMVMVPPVVLAVSPKPPVKKVAPTPTGKPVQSSSSRVIVQYKAAPASPTTPVVQAAARAQLRTKSTTTSTGSVPLSAKLLRTTTSGGKVVQVSRLLTPAEQAKLIAELKADPAVKSVQVDRMLRHMAYVDDEYFYQQWNFSSYTPGGTGADTAWDSATGTGVVVAVLDTGVVPHPDLDANMLQGYDFITDSFVSRRPTNARVPGAFDYGDYANGNYTETDDCGPYTGPSNSSWHGSHTAGTVAEVTNNVIGVAGVARDAKVLPVRVLGRCGGYTSDIADAITWASGGTVAGVPANANPAEVINLSLGGAGACDDVTQAAINGAVSRGTTVVVAAGNSGEDAAYFTPASCQNVISVGAARYNGGKAFYSNYGPSVDIAAPGGGGDVDGIPNGYVLQAGNSSATAPDLDPVTGPAYWYNAGTSMAAPHVAATAALVQSVVATPLTPAEMETLLKKSARPFPVSISPTTPIGVGLLNSANAVAKALEPPCDPQVQTCIDAIPVINKVNIVGIGGVTGSETLYSFAATAGAPLSILTFGGLGDVSVYVSFNQVPTTTSSQFRSVRAGNSETVRITAPQTGTYYIKLVGVRSFNNVTLSVRQ